MDGGWSVLVRIPFTLVPKQARAEVHEPDTDTRRWPWTVWEENETDNVRANRAERGNEFLSRCNSKTS